VASYPGQPLAKLEEAYIQLTLDHASGNRKLAAGVLGIRLRTPQNRIAEKPRPLIPAETQKLHLLPH
jgi:hypothetical protein